MKYEYETLLQHENVVMTGSDKKKYICGMTSAAKTYIGRKKTVRKPKHSSKW